MRKALYAGLLLLVSGCQTEDTLPAPGKTDETTVLDNRNLSLRVVATGVPAYVQDIHFRDALAGVAATRDGKIYQTADAGATWVSRYTNPSPDQPWHQIWFTDANVGYVVGGSVSCTGASCNHPRGRIVKTTDGGRSWTSIWQPHEADVAAIAANPAGELFAVLNTASSQIMRSADAGATWTAVASLPFQVTKIAFDQQLGYCTGVGSAATGGRLVRSTNNGRTWAVAAIVGDYPYLSGLAAGAGVGYCVAGYGKVYRTTDQGRSWTPTSTTRFSALVVKPLTASSCLLWGAGEYSGGDFGVFNGSVRQTKDAGATWTESVLPSVGAVHSASFYTPTAGYAVAGSKLIQVSVK